MRTGCNPEDSLMPGLTEAGSGGPCKDVAEMWLLFVPDSSSTPSAFGLTPSCCKSFVESEGCAAFASSVACIVVLSGGVAVTGDVLAGISLESPATSVVLVRSRVAAFEGLRLSVE